MSTFVGECDDATWRAAGFDRMNDIERKSALENIFAPELGGAQLIDNRSIWRQFPHIWCERWSHGNRVLLGDALRTAHFSIGSGTRLAIEDAIALADALDEADGDVAAGLAIYEAKRKPRVVVVSPSRDEASEEADDLAPARLRPRRVIVIK